MGLSLTRINRYPKNFSFTSTDGKSVTIADYQGKWLYLVFHRHLS